VTLEVPSTLRPMEAAPVNDLPTGHTPGLFNALN
jgi:hypothetical protein